jgi:peptidoglycan/LPS O-acetylase OafA/YrhL
MAAPPAAPAGARDWFPDTLKIVAAWCIVAHHLLRYGPLGEALAAVLPEALVAAADGGRLAVQVFLVLGGYLALRSLQQRPAPFAKRLLTRYQRLALPFAAALALSLIVQALLRAGLPADLLSSASLSAVVAHLLLLQDVLGFEALTAGAWYVAIDWQLAALLTLLVAALPPRWLTPALALGTLASAWGFNRWSGGDAWAPYFFAAYGLGALAAQSPRALRWVALGVAAALLLDFRGRLALALTVALLLPLPWRTASAPLSRALRWGSERAYALFLLHYPVLLLANAWFLAMGAWVHDGGLALFTTAVAVPLMVGAADAFHRWVDTPLQRRPLPRLVGARRAARAVRAARA